MFTLVAFSESIDEAGVMDNLKAVVDQTVKTNGDFVTVPTLNNIIGAAACIGTTGEMAKLEAPSIRRFNPQYMNPVNKLLVPSPYERRWLNPANPVPLETNESLEAQAQANPAAAEQHTIVVALADGPQAPVTGKIRQCQVTAVLTLTAGVWAFAELQFTDDLPVGDYQVVGARLVCAAGVAFRLVPVGAAHRPGGLCVSAYDSVEDPSQRNGNMGPWFTFNTTQPPGIEILSSAAAASATYTGFLDILTT